jgi:hypothetical protein
MSTIWAQRGALGRGRDPGACGAPASADLDSDAGVRREVHEPCRVLIGTALGGDHDVLAARGAVDQAGAARRTGPASGRGEHEGGHAVVLVTFGAAAQRDPAPSESTGTARRSLWSDRAMTTTRPPNTSRRLALGRCGRQPRSPIASTYRAYRDPRRRSRNPTLGSSTAVAQATDGPGLAAKALVRDAATIRALWSCRPASSTPSGPAARASSSRSRER